MGEGTTTFDDPSERNEELLTEICHSLLEQTLKLRYACVKTARD